VSDFLDSTRTSRCFRPLLVRLSSVLHPVCCVSFLPFSRPYLGALVTGWLEYPRFETLILLHRNGVSRFLVYRFGARLLFGSFALW
jgi:hypothetical protein